MAEDSIQSDKGQWNIIKRPHHWEDWDEGSDEPYDAAEEDLQSPVFVP